MTALFLLLVGLLAVAALVVAFVLSRYKVAGPHEAYVITGRKGRTTADADGQLTTDLSGQKVVMGASVFVVPFIQRLGILDLSSQQIAILVESAVSKNGIRCALRGVAVVKVGGTEDAVRAAAQRFLNQQDEVSNFTTEVLAGSLRSIVGRLTVEEIIRDRAAFAREVAQEAETALTPQGLVLDSFQLQDIQAEGTYLADLGRPEAARAQMEAKVAEAEAHRAAEEARIAAEQQVAEANRTLALRTAAIQSETDAARAEAAGPKAQAAQEREVLAQQQLAAQEQARLRELELDTEIRKPADAARYATEQSAEAAKTARIAEAEATKAATIAAAQASAEEARLTGAGERQRREELAEALRLEGQAEGDAEKARRAAGAEALRLEGQAEAEAIAARGEAEAEAMRQRAEAYEKYGAAAVTDLVVGKLPEIVRAGSEPLSAIDTMTVVSTDGASAITKSVATNVSQLMEVVSSLTGLDIADMIGGAVSGGKEPPAVEPQVVEADVVE